MPVPISYSNEFLFSCSVLSDSVTPWTVAHQAPLPMEFSRQEYQSGLSFPSAGNLPDPGIKPQFPALASNVLVIYVVCKCSSQSVTYLTSVICRQRFFIFVKSSSVFYVCFWCSKNLSTSSSVQSLSRVRLFATLWTAARQASMSITNSQSLLRLISIQLVMPSNHLVLSCLLLLLPSIFPGNRVFASESVLRITRPKYWNFSFNINHSNEYSGLISFRMDWLDLLSVQGTLKSLLQHHSSKASILRHSAFFIVQLSHPYMTTGKTMALTTRTFVGKVISLLFKCYLGWP